VEVILDIKSGPLAGKNVLVAAGQAVVIGRALDRPQFSVPHDNLMSGVHFAVECGSRECRVIDKKSTNGTFLNGARIQEAVLANGDEIKSGQTIFVVRIFPDSQLPAAASGATPATLKPPASAKPAAAVANVKPPGSSAPPLPQVIQPPAAISDLPPALTIGSWAFHKIPKGWQIQEGLGIQQVVKDAFPSSIGAIEEPLGPGLTLQHYIDAHTKMFREYLPDPKIEIAVPPVIRGSVETAALEIKYSHKEGPSIFFRRDYARCGSILGVLTLTTLEKDMPSIRPIYDSVLSTISFSHKEHA
jgi:hypothetical protein